MVGAFFITGFVQTIFAAPEQSKLKKSVVTQIVLRYKTEEVFSPFVFGPWQRRGVALFQYVGM